MKVNDAHVHTGYFPRMDRPDPFYYSPRRILGILNRCEVNEFIFSSTNAIWDVTGEAMHRETEEMLRIAGRRAHPFFWISGAFLKRNRDILIPSYYEGFKLHGAETRWLSHRKDFYRVLSIARERGFCVQIHTGKDRETGWIQDYAPFCAEFPEILFDLAHAQPAEYALNVLKRYPNIFVDTAFLPAHDAVPWFSEPNVRNRIMFGSDIPAPRKYRDISLTTYLRKEVYDFATASCHDIMANNMLAFLRKD